MGTQTQNAVRRLQAGISDDMRKALEDFIACKNPSAMISHLGWKPPTDVFETQQNITVRMDIAGMNPSDILLGFDGETNALTITGKRTDKTHERKTGYHQMEIIYGPFHRRVVIPKPVDLEKVTTSYNNGFLEITFPKTERSRRKIVSIKLSF